MTEPRNSWPWRYCLVATVATVVCIGLAGCDGAGRGDQGAGPADDRGGDTAAVTSTTVEAIEWIVHQQTVAELPGASVIGFESTVLVAKQAGYVKAIGRQGELEIDIGVSVTAGSVLAELYIPELKQELREKEAASRRALAEVVQSKAAVEIAKAIETQVIQNLAEKRALQDLREVELKRITMLVKMGAADRDKLDEAEFRKKAAIAAVLGTKAEQVTAGANIRKAEADVKQAEAEADVAAAAVERLEALNSYRLIKAPFDGVVVARHVDPGAFVRPAGSSASGSPLFEVTRIDRVRIVAFVPPSQVAVVQTGGKARFHHIGGLAEDAAVTGTVDRSARALDPSSRKMRIEMHVDNMVSDGRPTLLIGQFGTLSILGNVWTEDKKLGVVPSAAVGTDKQGRQFVVVVNGKVESRHVLVDTVVVGDGRVGVMGDIHPGDQVRVGDLSEY